MKESPQPADSSRQDWLDDDETRTYLLQLRKEVERTERRIADMSGSSSLKEIRIQSGVLRGLRKALKIADSRKADDDVEVAGPQAEE